MEYTRALATQPILPSTFTVRTSLGFTWGRQHRLQRAGCCCWVCAAPVLLLVSTPRCLWRAAGTVAASALQPALAPGARRALPHAAAAAATSAWNLHSELSRLDLRACGNPSLMLHSCRNNSQHSAHLLWCEEALLQVALLARLALGRLAFCERRGRLPVRRALPLQDLALVVGRLFEWRRPVVCCSPPASSPRCEEQAGSTLRH